jgi:hypothetical protein
MSNPPDETVEQIDQETAEILGVGPARLELGRWLGAGSV